MEVTKRMLKYVVKDVIEEGLKLGWRESRSLLQNVMFK